MLEMFGIIYTSMNFNCESTYDSKEISKLPLCCNVFDGGLDFEICGYHKNKKSFFLQIKKSLTTHQGLLYDKKYFIAEVTFNAHNYLYYKLSFIEHHR